MPTNGASITLYPAKQSVTSSGHVTVADYGKVPLQVTTHAVQLGSKCAMTTISGVRVQPAEFQLKPGQHQNVLVQLGGAHGDVGVVFSGVPAGAHGYVTGTGVGAQFLTGQTVSCVQHVHHAAVTASGSGFPLLWLVVGLIALVLAVVGTGVWMRRRA